MTEEREFDPTLFFTTLARWNQPAFFDEVGRRRGALAALEVVPPHDGPRGAALREAIGESVARRWLVMQEALAAWPGIVAQRGGWSLLWALVPDAEPGAVGAALAQALQPCAEPGLEGRLVVVAVGGPGAEAGRAAVRAAEDELHRWHHGTAAVERRWTDATPEGAARS